VSASLEVRTRASVHAFGGTNLGKPHGARAACLFLVAAICVACTGTPETPGDGPLVYQGFPQSWAGPVAVGQPRAWSLVLFGQEGLRATVTSVALDVPPAGLATRIELNSGEPIPVGGFDTPPGATPRSVPGTISGVVQIVVWFEPRQSGIEYFSPSITIGYSIGDDEYMATYPVGVGICSVEQVVPTTRCHAGASPAA
jgi:hypothetical protein